MEAKRGTITALWEWARGLQAWGIQARGPQGRPDLGRRGEDLAVRELERLGYEILERRWRCRFGEIDVVARDGETLVVVEVKTRSRSDYGSPASAVDGRKRRKLETLARAYLKARRLSDVAVRFDVVAVTAPPGAPPEVEIFPGALSF